MAAIEANDQQQETVSSMIGHINDALTAARLVQKRLVAEQTALVREMAAGMGRGGAS